MMQERQEQEAIARNLGFASTQDAAEQLGYHAGVKHDLAHPKPYRLSVKDTAGVLASQLGIYEGNQATFIAAYCRGCRQTRKEKKILRTLLKQVQN